MIKIGGKKIFEIFLISLLFKSYWEKKDPTDADIREFRSGSDEKPDPDPHPCFQEDFDGLNERVRHYMDWSKNSIHYLSLRKWTKLCIYYMHMDIDNWKKLENNLNKSQQFFFFLFFHLFPFTVLAFHCNIQKSRISGNVIRDIKMAGYAGHLCI